LGVEGSEIRGGPFLAVKQSWEDSPSPEIFPL